MRSKVAYFRLSTKIVLLFCSPLLVPFALWVWSTVRPPVVRQGALGNFRTNAEAERRVLQSLIYRLAHEPFDIVQIEWLVIHSKTKSGYDMRCGVYYNRIKSKLVYWKFDFKGRKNRVADESQQLFSGVNPDILRSVASTGTLSSLQKQGAIYEGESHSWPKEWLDR